MKKNSGNILISSLMLACITVLYFIVFDFDNNSFFIFTGEVVYSFVSLLAAYWLYLAYKQSPKREGIFWILLSIGFISSFIAELVWDYYDILKNTAVPFPGIPDFFYMIQFLLYLSAFVYKVVVEKRKSSLYRYFIDILIIATVVGTFSYYYLILPIIESPGFTGISLAVALAYPVGDFIILLLAIMVYFDLPKLARRNSLSFLFCGLLIMAASDLIYLYIQAVDSYQSWSFVDVFYLLSTFLIGYSGLRRSKTHQNLVTQISKKNDKTTGIVRHAVPSFLVLMLFTLLLFVQNLPIVIGTALSILLIICRQLVTIVQNEKLIEKIRQKSSASKVSEQKYRSLFDYHTDAVFSLDLEGKIQTGNPKFQALTGFGISEISNKHFLTLIPESDRQLAYNHFSRAKEGKTRYFDLSIEDKLGRQKYLSLDYVPIFQDYKVVGVFCIAKDITENKANEEKIQYLAFHDSLTGLPNRRHFENLLEMAVAEARQHEKMLAVLFIDLDHFKIINDTLGHAVGDQLLVKVGERLNQSISSDLVAGRHGGDEFILLIKNIESKNQIIESAEKLLTDLNEPYQIEKHRVNITPSIGISVFPDDAEDVQSLMQHADKAMYRVKHQGKNQFKIYTINNDAGSYRRLTIEKDIQNAIKNNELEVYYQPQINRKTGKIWGMEALVRWNHPQLGLISPGEFIPLAEVTGTIFELNEWVLEQACLQLSRWLDAGFDFRISVNISPQQFYIEEDLTAKVKMILDNCELHPSRLIIEITEEIAINNIEIAVEKLVSLRELGVQIALDDFGTGYSSLSYLTKLPIDIIKIAREFIDEMDAGSPNEAVLSSLVTMAKDLRLKVTIEGVETEKQLSRLARFKCDFMQGYYFSRPQPVEEIESFLMRWVEQSVYQKK